MTRTMTGRNNDVWKYLDMSAASSLQVKQTRDLKPCSILGPASARAVSNGLWEIASLPDSGEIYFNGM